MATVDEQLTHLQENWLATIVSVVVVIWIVSKVV